MSHPDNNDTKSNGIDPLQRLPSLKPKRDLSLGGMQPNKKIFTPNLNVSRNKNKQQSSTNSWDQKKDDKGRKDRRNDKNKNFRNGPNIIKSGGVFSEGLGGQERHSRGGGYGRDPESAASMQKPTLRVKQPSKIDKELEEQKLKAVMGEGYGDGDVSEDFKRSLDLETPIKLPMDDGNIEASLNICDSLCNKIRCCIDQNHYILRVIQLSQESLYRNGVFLHDESNKRYLRQARWCAWGPGCEATVDGWSVSQPKPAVAVKQEVIVKQEPPDYDTTGPPLEDLKPIPGIKKEVFEDTDVLKVLRRDDPTLILLQLPDTLPGRGRSGEDPPRRKANESTTSAGEQTTHEQVDERCHLSQLEEGKIGKLQIHRSGRVTLALGDTLLEVCSGTPPAFLQQVVSVGVEHSSRTAHAVTLGSLRHKLCAAPDWPRLLRGLPH